jgi:NAD(P)-dependent dehydrogenase (short-subunit alcohol dehydrogenase family)
MAFDPTSLAGKAIVVGGSTGALGGAIVKLALASGARVAAAVRKPWQVDKVKAEHPGATLLVGCVPDTDGEAAAGFAKGANDALGGIDALLCCNGAFAANPIGRDPAGELQELMTANVLSVANLARGAVGLMKRKKRGAIVCVGSAAVGGGGAHLANYLASKAALHEWVRALATELDGTGVRACAIVPGTIDTERNRRAMPDADPSKWLPLEIVARAMFAAAFAPQGSGPMFPVGKEG